MAKVVAILAVLIFCSIASTTKADEHIIVAAYSATRGQTDSTPNTTASGLKISNKHHGKVVALSYDLAKNHKFGDKFKLYVNGQCYDVVFEDIMNRKWRKRIDLLLPTTKHCFQWGLRKGLLVKAE
jgi:3D (Asp-Asp-Asp) domain-containing protein